MTQNGLTLSVVLLFCSSTVLSVTTPKPGQGLDDLQELMNNFPGQPKDPKPKIEVPKTIQDKNQILPNVVTEKVNQDVVKRLSDTQQQQNIKIERITKELNELSENVYKSFKPDIEDFPRRDKSRARDCSDLFKSGINESGIYLIYPMGSSEEIGFRVFCDMETDRGGWTVFQRRGKFDIPVDYFHKTWQDYKYGFGHMQEDFWLGNDLTSSLSRQRRYQLRIDLWDKLGKNVFAKYDRFWLEAEAQHYALHVGGFMGNATNGLLLNNRRSFSTRDHDNDPDPKVNHADVKKGGWWFDGLSKANLNGAKNPTGEYQLKWNDALPATFTVHFTEMKMRPRDF